MKDQIKYALLILGYIGILAVVSYLKPQEVDWTASYSSSDSNPFGSEVVFESLDHLFPKDGLSVLDESLYEFGQKDSIVDLNLIFVQDRFEVNELDYKILIDKLKRGAHIFIAAHEIDPLFTDSVGILLSDDWQYFHFGNDTTTGPSDCHVHLTGDFFPHSQFSLKCTDQRISYFSIEKENFGHQILGMNSDSNVNFLTYQLGEGRIFLHSMPIAFTNYQILERESVDYISSCLSLMPERKTLWVEYGKSRVETNIYGEILKNKAMQKAWYLLLTTGVLYVLFHSKRRQRAIPVINAYENTSVNYARVIGSLFQEEGSPDDILFKRRRYFKEYLARKYFMKDIEFSEEEAIKLSKKSAYPQERMKRLFLIMKNLEGRQGITNGQLFAACKRLNEFYTKN